MLCLLPIERNNFDCSEQSFVPCCSECTSDGHLNAQRNKFAYQCRVTALVEKGTRKAALLGEAVRLKKFVGNRFVRGSRLISTYALPNKLKALMRQRFE